MKQETRKRWGGAAAMIVSIAGVPAIGQEILFDFNNAPIHTSLPIDVAAGGITAHLSATGQGFSIQRADTLGFTPAGFSGLCIYPNSVFPADLLVGFSEPMRGFSILYSPQELGCDDSARMRVTAYFDATFIGTATKVSETHGTWPTATLSITTSQPFNRVVVHYDARPPTCSDWGPIFLADNMRVSPVCAADLSGSSDPNDTGYGVPDGALDASDFFYFLDQFTAGDTAIGDLSGSSDPNDPAYGVPDGAIDASDFFYYLDLFAAGCG